MAAKTPTPTPTKAPKLVNRANKIAKTPILKAGIKIFIPSLSDIFSIYSFDGSRLSPLLTFLAIAGMVIAKIKPPFTIAGSHLPPAITTPKTVQKRLTHNDEDWFYLLNFLLQCKSIRVPSRYKGSPVIYRLIKYQDL